MPSGGKREGAGRKSRFPPPKTTRSFTLSEQIQATLALAYDDWHTENQDASLSEFVETVLRESERVKGFGV